MAAQNGNGNHVFGLIDSAWGGTKIEPWSSQAALDACGVDAFVDPNNPASSNSYIWNAMIHPFLRHNIYGGLWYQGKMPLEPKTFLLKKLNASKNFRGIQCWLE